MREASFKGAGFDQDSGVAQQREAFALHPRIGILHRADDPRDPCIDQRLGAE